MKHPKREPVINDLNGRVARIEQLLPTLATKDDLRKAIAPLATRAEMHEAIAAAVAPLPTRVEMHAAIREEGEQTRRHFNVVAERLETSTRLIAEGQGALQDQFTEFRVEVTG